MNFTIVAEQADHPMVDNNVNVTAREHHSSVRSLLEKERLRNVQISDRLEDAERQGRLPECGIVIGSERRGPAGRDIGCKGGVSWMAVVGRSKPQHVGEREELSARFEGVQDKPWMNTSLLGCGSRRFEANIQLECLIV